MNIVYFKLISKVYAILYTDDLLKSLESTEP